MKVVGSPLSQPTVLTASLALINSILKYSCVWKFFSNPLTDHDAQELTNTIKALRAHAP